MLTSAMASTEDENILSSSAKRRSRYQSHKALHRAPTQFVARFDYIDSKLEAIMEQMAKVATQEDTSRTDNMGIRLNRLDLLLFRTSPSDVAKLEAANKPKD